VLDLRGDPIELTAALVDIPSESMDEARIADEVEAALRAQTSGFEIVRNGNAVLARTSQHRPSRVLLAGHLDTVPAAENLPSRLANGELHGCGTADMKSGDAVFLHLAATVAKPAHDLTLVFYDCEEIEAAANGLGRIERELPDWLTADVAILGEPTAGYIEAGCQGTMRAEVTATGRRAHSARSWMGRNAIHEAGGIIDILRRYEPGQPTVDGLVYHEGLNAVGITGGVAGNVIPDRCVVTVNYRFAPDRDVAAAERHLREVFGGWDVTIVDVAPGARPGLDQGPAASFAAAVGGAPRAKLGWTDVARFAELGIPAVNYGPGISEIAHTADEYVEVPKIFDCEERMRGWLTRP